MGLKKIKTLNTGYQAEYFRLLEIHFNANRNDAVCVFALYKDKATRDADENAIIETVQFNLNSELLSAQGNTDTVKNINIAKAYTALKNIAAAEAEKSEDKNEELAFFADATDEI